MQNILYLASKSPSRHQLLHESKIPFSVIEQNADETKCDWGMSLPQLVTSIARYKMDHVLVPQGQEGQMCYVLTADTLSQDKDGMIQGKPTSRADAIMKIKKAQSGSLLATAFCLDRKIFKNGSWHIDQRIEQCVSAEYEFIVPDNWIDNYLDNSLGLSASNAIAIEGYGAQFTKIVHGSYSTIIGLPMFELRQALEALKFFM